MLVEMNLTGGSVPSGGSRGGPARKQPLTVTAQFYHSLHSLMQTLNMANPFFIRCIKSNADKIPNKLDEKISRRQLQYTGMLETVRIRQAGYSVRLTFQEFINYYRILLPKGLQSSSDDVRHFLMKQNLDQSNYQIGETKIYFRDSEKLKLDNRLHKEILLRIVTIQRWFRALAERQQYLRMREAAIVIQTAWRCWLAQRQLQNLKIRHMAATFLQKMWRGYCMKKWYRNLRSSVINFQAAMRGNLTRQKVKPLLEEAKQKREEMELVESDTLEEDFVFKVPGPVDEEENGPHSRYYRDSEESSEIMADSENESVTSESQYKEKKKSTNLFNIRRSGEMGLSLPRNKSNKPTVTSTKAEIHATTTEKVLEEMSVINKEKAKMQDVTMPRGSPLRFAKKQWKVLVEGKKGGKKTSEGVASESETEDTDRSITSECKEALWTLELREERRLERKRLIAEREQHRSRSGSLILDDQIDKRVHDRRCSHAVDKVLTSDLFNSAFWSSQGTVSPAESAPELGIKCHRLDSTSSQPVELRSTYEKPSTRSISVPEQISKSCDIQSYYTHNLHKVARTYRQDKCARCSQNLSTKFFSPLLKCSVCKKVFHQKCADGYARSVPCEPTTLSGRRKGSLRSRGMKWNITGSSEFTDREDQVISDAAELSNLITFISRKINEMEAPGKEKKESSVDRVFNEALREFRSDLYSTCSVLQGPISLKYKDLINNFSKVMEKVCEKDIESADSFPKTMGANAFRGFVDEFLKEGMKVPPLKRPKRTTKRQTKRGSQTISVLGHQFLALMVNIPTGCEICHNFINVTEKGLVCDGCKLTCHKRCSIEVKNGCCRENSKSIIHPAARHNLFGVPLEALISGDRKIPAVVDKLISSIELDGLYSEGLYRKPGVKNRIRRLKEALNDNLEAVDCSEYSLPVLTSTLKQFLRELPEPLLTYERYEDFVRAGDMEGQEEEQITCILAITRKLPQTHYDLLERLLFHLSRIALHESYNRMGPQQLAVVLSPCFLRSPANHSAQEALANVSSETRCVERMIRAKLLDVSETLEEIERIDKQTDPESLGGEDALDQVKRELLEGLPNLPRIDSEEDLLMDMDDIDGANSGSMSSLTGVADASVTSVYHTLGIDYEDDAVMV